MKIAWRLHPMVLAVSGALTLMAGAVQAQGFDANSVAVRQAYAGLATQEKKDTALAGPLPLLDFSRCVGFCSPGSGGGVILTVGHQPPFVFDPSPRIFTTIAAANDGDLGAPGASVTLNNTLLRTLASFSTPRDFSIGTGGAVIDTNNFTLSITGNLTANGPLVKDGQGTLVLTGNNLWTSGLKVAGGVLEGNASSLQTAITNHGTVRFNQTVDGIYSGVMARSLVSLFDPTHGNFEKTGSGKLTITNAQSYGGTTAILGGTLALQGAGTLGDTTALSISSGATFDLAGSSILIHEAGALSGGGSIVLGSNGIRASTSLNSEYSGSIAGSGGLGKSGSGTLTLAGNNSYTGGTSISDGTLALAGAGRLNAQGRVWLFNPALFDISASTGAQEVGSISGSGNIRLGTSTLTIGGNNENSDFSGTVIGSGGLTKIGTGYLQLTGSNSYTGTTTINQGNLIATTYALSDRVINNATLTLTESKGVAVPFLSDYSGNISGTGRLVKEGDGFIWLRGHNTFTGGTTVALGALIGNSDSLQGNITNNAVLAFYQVDNGTYAGNLSGSGTLLQYGPGALTLAGTNTYTGGTAFSGTLRVDHDANLGAASGALILAGGTLQIGADMTMARNIALSPAGGTFDTNGNRLTVSGNISGPGDLTKSGTGTLSLNGANTNLGATKVNAGRLEVNGSINSNVLVAAGAELGGSGIITGNAIINRGRLARGTGIGDMRVEGNVTFETGSALTVKTNAAGDSDRLQVSAMPVTANTAAPSGRVTLNGGAVEVLAETGNYRRETRYNIVNAANGVSGQFAGVTSNFAFLNPSLAYDANNVYLSLTRNDLDYATVAQTPNQSVVAQSLTRMMGSPSGDAATVTAVLDGLSASQARAAFDSIGAAGRAALPQAASFSQRAVNQNLVARLGIAEGGNTLVPATGIAGRAVQIAFDERARSDATPVYAQAAMPAGGQGLRSAGSEPANGFWLRGYGGTGRIDGDANAPGAKYNFGGTLFGYDRKLNDGLRLGVFGGYAEPRYEQDVATSTARTRTYQAGGYGRLRSGAWHVDAIASYARNDTNTSRVVTVGTLNRPANGSYKGDTVSAQVETGYTLKAGSVEVQPLAALSWVRQTQNAYSENGAGALNLVLSKQSQESLRSTLGVRTLHPFQAGAAQAVFEVRAGWAHEFDNTRNISARLAGDPAAAVFTLSGPSLPRDSAVVGVGIAAQAARNLRLYADLNGEFSGRSRAGALSVGLRYQW